MPNQLDLYGEQGRTLVICDGLVEAPKSGSIYWWNGYDKKSVGHSILRIVEDNSDHFRNQLLIILNQFFTEVHEKYGFGSSSSEGEFLVGRMSLLAEKSTYKSRAFLNIVRFLALERVLKEQEHDAIHYIGPEPDIAEALTQFCNQAQLKFVWSRVALEERQRLKGRVREKIPMLIRSVTFFFMYLWKHWYLRKTKNANWVDSKETVCFFSYFVHLNKDRCKSGEFYSNYWETLPRLLNSYGKALNWLHVFLFSDTVPDTRTAARWIERFNTTDENREQHATLESYLNVQIVGKVLVDWVCLLRKWLLHGRGDRNYSQENPYYWLWPLLRDDWKDSIIGGTAIRNLLWVYLLDRAVGDLPPQRTGLYLCENQGWERALVYLWRKHGHGDLIGVIHSTVSYWDLRFFNSPMAAQYQGYGSFQPDVVAVNGPAAWNTLAEAGQTMENCVSVEALRYLYLARPLNEVEYKPSTQIGEKLGLLVLCDVRPDTTHQMLVEVEKAYQRLGKNYEIFVKPHPANPVELDKYPQLQAVLVDQPLEDSFKNTQVVLASVYTSSAVDAISYGLDVVGFLIPNDFNFSPLRAFDNLDFVGSADDLVNALKLIETSKSSDFNVEDLFWIDNNLPRWKHFLDLNSKNSAGSDSNNSNVLWGSGGSGVLESD